MRVLSICPLLSLVDLLRDPGLGFGQELRVVWPSHGPGLAQSHTEVGLRALAQGLCPSGGQ